MPRTIYLLLLSLIPLLTQPAMAQESASPAAQVASEPLPNLMPGPTLKPKVTRTKRGADKAEEFRIGGKFYMVKVSPKQGKAYYLVDEKGNGSFARSDLANIEKQVPPWVMSQFYCPNY